MDMSLILVNSSAVLVTQDPPPVNHDFLASQKVIPESFRKAPASFSTPVVNQIHYENGFSITVEPQRTVIQFQKPSADESKNLENWTGR